MTARRARVLRQDAEHASATRSAIRGALARSALWELLSRTFGEAEPAFRETLAPARLLLAEIPDAVGSAIRLRLSRFLAAVDRVPPEARAEAHRALFTHTRSVDCPQYEAPYRSHDIFQEGQELADVSGFYRAFGFECGGRLRERPDHVAVEAEFLHVLQQLRALALGEGSIGRAEVCETAYRHFMRDHALTWLPSFAERVILRSGRRYPLYRAAARLLQALLDGEAGRLRLTPGPPDIAPLPPPAAEDDSCPVIPFPGVFGRGN